MCLGARGPHAMRRAGSRRISRSCGFGQALVTLNKRCGCADLACRPPHRLALRLRKRWSFKPTERVSEDSHYHEHYPCPCDLIFFHVMLRDSCQAGNHGRPSDDRWIHPELIIAARSAIRIEKAKRNKRCFILSIGVPY
jgi:hypothetical protein